ncbi:hypothetical protein [Deinococcus marmoris]|uniref:Uncharacterized protein n=1 Tax=Deinococcus marmoris TaxID=249408 RepID=A0A1U7NXB2_9DEIO|nr:hypothetical protein [Deinococcus marmoris]OLV17561.1 hypothetical protein BOO71_0008203 [Deinococcus marmoris]
MNNSKTISAPIFPTAEQAADLDSVAERLRDIRSWCQAQATGVMAPKVTLAEFARGEPAVSCRSADEAQALRRMTRYADIPLCVLTETIRERRRLIHQEVRDAGQPRAYEDVWQTFEVEIAGRGWCMAVSAQQVQLQGLVAPMRTQLDPRLLPQLAAGPLTLAWVQVEQTDTGWWLKIRLA